MKYFYFLTLWLYPFLSKGQELIHFNDTMYFQVFEREDTLDIDGSFPTPFPNTLKLDVNCDGKNDITFNCYTTPIQNFPSAHHIVIKNLMGSDMEFLMEGASLNAFRYDAEINLDSTNGWKSQDSFRLFYFNVIGGALWAGVKSTDSTSVSNMYLLFRIKEGNEYQYGWINYSGKSWPTRLIIHKLAFFKNNCLLINTKDQNFRYGKVRIFPNPFHDNFTIDIPNLNYQSLSWKIFNGFNVLESEGVITDKPSILDFSHRLNENGIFLLQIIVDGKICVSQWLIKI